MLAYLFWRYLRQPAYRRHFLERFGRLPATYRATAPGAIWFHAVSVGEVLAAGNLIRALRRQFSLKPVFLSCGTVAGRLVAEQKLAAELDGIFYAPVDYRFAVRSVLRAIRPSVVVVLETEIWPNLYRETRRSGAGLIVVNGRISDRTYPRYRKLRWFLRYVLDLPQVILAQSPLMADRFRHAGAPGGNVLEGGNLKYDFDPDQAPVHPDVARFLDALRPAAVWIAASTMPPAHAADVDEDEVVLDAFEQLRQKYPGLLLILAPRRPERFDVVAGKLRTRHLQWIRRTELRPGIRLELPGVLLLDTVGELAGLYRLADVVFVGGTLAERGGHNILEPAFFARPVVVGPHLENFPDMAREFRAAGAMVSIHHPEELAIAMDELLGNEQQRAKLGARARLIAQQKRGASEKAMWWIRELMASCVVRPPQPLWAWIGLAPLAGLWWLGTEIKRAWARRTRKVLATPVVSVGALTIGGAGKTPFVLALCRWLNEAGLRPGILTRGYRRTVPEKVTVVAPGAKLDVRRTGDEAQLLIRPGWAVVGIGANRYLVGQWLERTWQPDVLVLDDGFQHWRLHRDLDIVLVDALDPIGGGHLVPLGRLREPLRALQRADLIVITRYREDRPIAGIESLIRRYNRRAPCFRAAVRPSRCFDLRRGEEVPLETLAQLPLAAFCGLANPAAFWDTLRELGCQVVFRWAFPDHHHYRPGELRCLAREARAAGAAALVTTEKDAVNLPNGFEEVLGDWPVYSLGIELEVVEEARLREALLQVLTMRPRRQAS